MSRLARIQNTLLDATCGHRVVFHHVPKCGGTSVQRALRARYLLSFRGFPSDPTYRAAETLHPDYDERAILMQVIDFREYQLLFYLHQDVRCIGGHVRFSEAAFNEFSDRYMFITILRDPVSLMISSYFFDKLHRRQINSRWQTNYDIETYLESPRGNLLSTVYSHFFSGLSMDKDPAYPESIEKAKKNIRRFTVVGFTDTMELFQKTLQDVLGVRIRIGHINKSAADRREHEAIVTADVRRKIEAQSGPSLEIYEFARSALGQ